LSELASLGGIGGTTSSFVADQIDVMKSRRIFRKVVEQNRLNVIYYNKGNLKSNELMESQSPLKLVILDVNNSKLDSVRYDFVIKKKDNNKYTIEDKVNGLRDYILGQKISSPIGPIMILPQGNKGIDSDMIISYFPLNDVIDVLLNSVQIAPNKEKQSYVVNFSMNSGNINKAELILKSLIEQYNKDVSDDKSKISKATIQFIDTRLELISKNLSDADSKVADYKDQNNLVDMNSEVQLYMQNASENERKLVDYETQLRLADMMR